jgi:hypothetical protein
MRSASVNASDTGVPAPPTSGFVARHARKCSSDRKNFRVVQSEVETVARPRTASPPTP